MTFTRQKQLTELVMKKGFNLFDIKIVPISEDQFSAQFTRINEFNFSIRPEEGKCYYSPAADGKMFASVLASSWTQYKSAFESWLHYLNQNLAHEKIINEIGGISESFHTEDTSYFNVDEVNLLHGKIDIVLEALKEFAFDFERIKSDLEYIKYSGERASKKDWSLMFMGSFLGWIVDKAIPSEKANEILSSIKETFTTGNNLLGS